MDKIDRMYERKKFFRILYSEAIGECNNLKDSQYVTFFQYKKSEEEGKDDYKHTEHFKNIDDLNIYTENRVFNANTYFNLATTDGNGRATENLKSRYFLAWDFDKNKDPTLDAKEVMFRFKKLKLWYHILIDSGNGYHVYTIINKTDDLQKVEEVTKAIGTKLGSGIDLGAMLKTQVLRVPFTYNLKDKTYKQVNIIQMFPKDTVKPYDIDKLYKKYCNKVSEDRTIKYALDKSRFPPCVVNMLKGVPDGYRNFAIKRLISFLKLYKYSQSESWNVIKEWNYKNQPRMPDKELEYQFNYIWSKPYNYCGCIISKDTGLQAKLNTYCDKEACRHKSRDDILFVEGETIQMEYKICKKIEPQRKGSFQLKGNHLLLISIFKNNPEGLGTNEIIQNLTYKGKCCLSNKTLGEALNELSENGYLTRIKGNRRIKEKDFFKLNDIKCEEVEKFNISYSSALGVIAKLISPEDFKIYCYLRYRLSKGLTITQEKLADELGMERTAITYHINNLLESKYLELKCVDFSNGYGRNVYKINH